MGKDRKTGLRHLSRLARGGLMACLGGLVLLMAQSWLPSPTVAGAADRPLLAVATIAQIGEPLRVIAGDRAEIVTMMGEGVDPHLYRPTRTDIVKLTRADVVFYSGLNLEAQLKEPLARLAKQKPVLAVSEALPMDLLLQAADRTTSYPDPHVWMSPMLWARALAAAVDALAEADPGNAGFYRAGLADYQRRLEALADFIGQATEAVPPERRALVTAHDAFGYFGHAFGFEVFGIQGISTESEAGLRRIEELVELLVSREIDAVFVESSVSDRSVRALIDGAAARGHKVSIGGELFSDAMGAPGTYEGTYIGMLDHNATTIVRALGGDAPAAGMQGKLTQLSN